MGIVIDGELAHTGVTGYRDVPSKAPVTPDSVFRIASMTKSFTAIAILKLRDEGKLSLDDPAEQYVPEMKALVYPTSDSPRLTIRHLLSHAEGFPEDNPWGDQQLADTDEQLSALISGGIPFSNAPGVAYEVLQLRLRDPRPRRRQRQRLTRGGSMTRPTAAYDAVRDRERPEAARHDVDDARAVDACRRIAWRTATAGRTTSGRTSRCWRTARSARWAAC